MCVCPVAGCPIAIVGHHVVAGNLSNGRRLLVEPEGLETRAVVDAVQHRGCSPLQKARRPKRSAMAPIGACDTPQTMFWIATASESRPGNATEAGSSRSVSRYQASRRLTRYAYSAGIRCRMKNARGV